MGTEKSDLNYVVKALEDLGEKISKEVDFLEKHNFKVEVMFKKEQWQLVDKIRRNIYFIDRYEDEKIENICFTKNV